MGVTKETIIIYRVQNIMKKKNEQIKVLLSL